MDFYRRCEYFYIPMSCKFVDMPLKKRHTVSFTSSLSLKFAPAKCSFNNEYHIRSYWVPSLDYTMGIMSHPSICRRATIVWATWGRELSWERDT